MGAISFREQGQVTGSYWEQVIPQLRSGTTSSWLGHVGEEQLSKGLRVMLALQSAGTCGSTVQVTC